MQNTKEPEDDFRLFFFPRGSFSQLDNG